MKVYAIKIQRQLHEWNGATRTYGELVWKTYYHSPDFGVARLYDTYGKALGVAKRIAGSHTTKKVEFEIVEVELVD